MLNASPLIVLFKADLAHALPQIFTEILVPGAVWEEVAAGGSSDQAARQLPMVDRAKRVELATVSPAVLSWNLGKGEAEVLTIVISHPGYRAVVDDAAARRCARSLQLSTLGTGGVLLLAKRRGLIPSVGTALGQLRKAGFWLSDDLVAMLIRQAGE